MEFFSLDNGMNIPCIGYGTFPQKETLENNIPLSYSYGYKLIDTSDNYFNEEFIGNGMSKLSKEETDFVVMITKFSRPYQAHNLQHCFEESFIKLGYSKNIIYLMHWPYPFLWKYLWKKMEEIYLSGQCKAIGVCNFEKKHLKRLLKFCRVKPMIDQFERHPLFQQNETFEYCKANGIQVMSYTPIARINEGIINNKVLEEIANKYNKSVVQIVLRWHIEHKCIPIPASSSGGAHV